MLVKLGIELLIASRHSASLSCRDSLYSCSIALGADREHVIFSRLGLLHDGATVLITWNGLAGRESKQVKRPGHDVQVKMISATKS